MSSIWDWVTSSDKKENNEAEKENRKAHKDFLTSSERLADELNKILAVGEKSNG